MELFEVAPDKRCQRGLTFRYYLKEPPDDEAMLEAFDERSSLPMITGQENWAGQMIHRRILQFRFEVRFGERAGEITFRHRATAQQEQRTSDRAWFEALLTEILAPS